MILRSTAERHRDESRRVIGALDCRRRQIGQWMADEGGIHSALTIKLFLEGEDHQRLVDVVAQQADASLTPCPELRSNVVDKQNATLLFISRATRQLKAGESMTMARSGLASSTFSRCW